MQYLVIAPTTAFKNMNDSSSLRARAFASEKERSNLFWSKIASTRTTQHSFAMTTSFKCGCPVTARQVVADTNGGTGPLLYPSANRGYPKQPLSLLRPRQSDRPHGWWITGGR